MTEPFVVVGGDAAGLSAASKCKREDPDREVVVFERGEWISYAHCGTPYYVKGEVEELTDLLSLRPEDVEERGIDLRRNHEVVSLDSDEDVVTVDGPDGRFEQPFDDLLVATGARATAGPIDGHDLDGVFTLHGLDDAAAMRAFLAEPDAVDPVAVDASYVDRERVRHNAALQPPESVAIVGGGYVGVEMAEALSAHDLSVHLFQRPEHLLPPFGEAVAEAIEEHLAEQGVELHLGASVGFLAGEERVEAVEYDGASLDVEMAVVGVGIEPNVGLVGGGGVELGATGAIVNDAYGRTSRNSVYAAGDCAEALNVVTGEPDWVPLGLTANRAGRAIGSTVAGSPEPVGGIAGTAAVKAFELEAARTGLLDEDRARDAGFDPVSRTITAGSRSGYYPGAEETTVVLVADRDSGRLLGGSIVGKDRAAIRIDTVATALEAGLTVDELMRTDLAYAPPFSPVWDPVLVAAKVLEGELGG